MTFNSAHKINFFQISTVKNLSSSKSEEEEESFEM